MIYLLNLLFHMFISMLPRTLYFIIRVCPVICLEKIGYRKQIYTNTLYICVDHLKHIIKNYKKVRYYFKKILNKIIKIKLHERN